jgi:ubiquinone/menaquinone biosynthesis C-methylase UbiE
MDKTDLRVKERPLTGLLSREEDTLRLFSKWSHFYDSKLIKLLYFDRVQPSILEELAGIIKKFSGKTLRCVDVACGTGEIIFKLASQFPDIEFIGTDFSEAMLRVARVKCSMLPNTQFVLANVQELPFEHDAFDLSICTDALHHFSSPAESFAEIRRITKKGGHVFVADPANDTFLKKIILKLFGTIFDKPQKYYSREEVEDLLAHTNFTTALYRYRYFTNLFIAEK